MGPFRAQAWKRVIIEDYCRPTSEAHLPGCYTCIRPLVLVLAQQVLMVEPPDSVEMDGDELVIRQLGAAIRARETDQAERRKQGEAISDMQARLECATDCIGAVTVRVPLRGIRYISPADASEGKDERLARATLIH